MNKLPPEGDIQASKQRFIHCAQKGILKHAISTEEGGYGDSFTHLVLSHEILGKSCLDNGLLLSINAHLWGSVFPLINYGNKEQKQVYLSKLLSGDLISGHAITEPQAGSDLNALLMIAESTPEGLLLNGHKRFITNTPIADLLIIYARLDNKLSAFIVHSDDLGALFLNQPNVTGCHSATMGDIKLENCLIPKSRQLGKTGAGNIMIQQALELERAFIFAGICGVMNWQLKTVIQFSRQRKVNNLHLGKNQAISHKIAEMKLRLDSIRLWVNECARLKDNNKRITMASAQTKLFAAEAFLQSSLDAVQILGSNGLAENNPIAQLVNDALASRLFSGSSEIQKNIIVALLGTGDGYK
ncbi:MAG: acyl-CoA dehydrogenase family protein [Methylococcales bacterium]|nr:acyl-CoA dehydrogenase family protein [Methylococcales bacterium]